MTLLYQWKSSCYPVHALISRTFKCKTQSFSVPCSIAHLIHVSSCGVAIQTIPSSARPRKDHPLMAPCVGMGRYLHNPFSNSLQPCCVNTHNKVFTSSCTNIFYKTMCFNGVNLSCSLPNDLVYPWNVPKWCFIELFNDDIQAKYPRDAAIL